MKDIKTREAERGIRTLDRAANMVDRMKNTYLRAKYLSEQTLHANSDSTSGFAEERVAENARDLVHTASYELQHHGKHLTQIMHTKNFTKGNTLKTVQLNKKKDFSQGLPVSSCRIYDSPANRYEFKNKNVARLLERTNSNYDEKETRRSIRTARCSIKPRARALGRAVNTSLQGSSKTANRSIKTAKKTSYAAIKTTQTTGKTITRTAQTTTKATQRAVHAAKATEKVIAAATKAVAKAIAATVKGAIAAVKDFIIVISVGGGVAVIAIVVIILAYIYATFIACLALG